MITAPKLTFCKLNMQVQKKNIPMYIAVGRESYNQCCNVFR